MIRKNPVFVMFPPKRSNTFFFKKDKEKISQFLKY